MYINQYKQFMINYYSNGLWESEYTSLGIEFCKYFNVNCADIKAELDDEKVKKIITKRYIIH